MRDREVCVCVCVCVCVPWLLSRSGEREGRGGRRGEGRGGRTSAADLFAGAMGPIARAEAVVYRKRLYRGRGAASDCLHAISVCARSELLLSLVPVPDCPEYARSTEYGIRCCKCYQSFDRPVPVDWCGTSCRVVAVAVALCSVTINPLLVLARVFTGDPS